MKIRLCSVLITKAYRYGKAKGNMQLFSESELEQLIVLVQSPAYAIMQSKRLEIGAMLMQNIIGMA